MDEREQIELFAEVLWPRLDDDEYIELRAFSVPARKPLQRWVRKPYELVINAQELREDHDVYVGVCPRVGQTGNARAIRHMWVLWADLDFKNGYDRDKRMRQVVEIADPTICVHSGGGIHAYWRLHEPLTERRIRGGSELMGHISRMLDADNVGDPPRILRLPGTYNWKTGQPVPVVLQ